MWIMMVIFVLASIGGKAQAQGSSLPKIIAGMYQEYKEKSFPEIPEITVEQALALQDSTPILFLDVREPREIAVSRIPGGISGREFEKDKERYRDRPIIVYCTIGYRSGLYTKELLEQNFDARNLIGGILAWAQAGKIFDAGKGDSLTAHVYGKKWNLLPPNYKAVW